MIRVVYMTKETYKALSDYLLQNDLIVDELSAYVPFDEMGRIRNARNLYDELLYRHAYGDKISSIFDAISWLEINDPSLRNSLKLADDMGYKMSNLDSIKLARNLQLDMWRRIYMSMINEIDDKFFVD